MKKTKRILASIGIILLVALYGSTLIFAFIDNSKTMSFFKASIAATIFVPVLLYAYTLFYKLFNNKDHNDRKE